MGDSQKAIDGRQLVDTALALEPDERRAFVDGLSDVELDAAIRAADERAGKQHRVLSATDQVLWDAACRRQH